MATSFSNFLKDGTNSVEDLAEAGTRAGKAIGTIKIGGAFQIKSAVSETGKATVIVTDIDVRYGIGDPTTTIYYKYKLGSKKGNESNTLKRFLEMMELGVK